MERGTFQTLNKYYFNAEDDWGCYNEEGKYLKGSFDKDGYNRHNLRCTDGKKHTLREHNMKWEYFNGKIPEGYVIDHIIPISNGGTNKLSNLRIVTPKDNQNNPRTLENMSKALKGKYVGKNHWNYGKKHSKETIEKMSKSASERQFGENNPMYGKHWNENQKLASEKRRKKIIQITQDGEMITHNSFKSIVNEKYNYSSLLYACRGKYKGNSHQYKDSYWFYD